MDRWEIEKKIVMKALKDPAFRKQLLSQKKTTLREFLKNETGFNVSLLDMLNIKVVEEEQAEWIIALPQIPKELSALSEAEMEKLFAASEEDFPDAEHRNNSTLW